MLSAVVLAANHLPLVAPVSAQNQKPEITLTWSTNSYVPFDYPAKALPAKNSIIEIAAVIAPQNINPQALNYYWYLDDNLERSGSGLAKDVFLFKTTKNAGQSHQIKLWLKNQAGAFMGEKTIEIKIVAPEIHLGSLISDLKSGEEKQFIALPYFFNIKSVDDLNYNWSFGQEKAQIAAPENPGIFLLKVGQIAKTISQELKLLAENKNDFSQRAEAKLKITLRP